MKREGWTRLSDPKKGKCEAHWQHTSGWEIRHCGHPTANWPYYLQDPERQELCVMTHNGLGFATLKCAMLAVEEIAAGRAQATTDNCVGGVARVVPPEACFIDLRAQLTRGKGAANA